MSLDDNAISVLASDVVVCCGLEGAALVTSVVLAREGCPSANVNRV